MKLPHHQIGRIDFVYNSFLVLVDVFGADKDAKRTDDKVPIISIITNARHLKECKKYTMVVTSEHALPQLVEGAAHSGHHHR